jgi:hypothetical protein
VMMMMMRRRRRRRMKTGKGNVEYNPHAKC